MKSTLRRAFSAIAIASTLGTALMVAMPGVALATSGWDGKNPAATVCGNGTYNITTLSNGYAWMMLNGLRAAYVEVRYSAACGTAWTRVTNETGRGSGYAPARDIRMTEQLYWGINGTQAIGMDGESDTLHRYGTFPYQGWTMMWSNQNPGSPFWLQGVASGDWAGPSTMTPWVHP